MTADDFLVLIERLTGSPAKALNARDNAHLTEALENDAVEIDAHQFNELLLLANKDRVSTVFFAYFFCKEQPHGMCAIGKLQEGVACFQKMAMLCFGNFIYAFRQLSKITSLTALKASFGRHQLASSDLRKRFEARRPSILSVTAIPRKDTYLVGYLSAGELTADTKRSRVIEELIVAGKATEWSTLKDAITESYADTSEAVMMHKIADRFRTLSPDGAKPPDILSSVQDGLTKLEIARTKMENVRATATRNSDVYLTWDHMDIYFATSMRKKWEYEDLHEFVSTLTGRSELKSLKVRYFDPTQSYDDDRISKGLIEALMLKRASCTVYSIQDTDTLGKDSELAATLAQGKPVIAYAPTIDIEGRKTQLLTESPLIIRERMAFVVVHDEPTNMALDDDPSIGQAFATALEEFEARIPHRSLPQVEEEERFRAQNSALLDTVCALLANAERRIYDKRASTLKDAHPLGIQVHLETGVANGVLVARDIPTCAELVRRVLLNELTFRLEDDPKSNCWLLREELTDSVFRLVSRNQKLTNGFWNFYRNDVTQEAYDEGA